MNLFFKIMLFILGAFFIGAFIVLNVDAIKKFKNANVALGIVHSALSIFVLVASMASFSFALN